MNPKTTERYTIAGPAGDLEIALNVPPAPLAGIALVAHPNPVEGGTLDNKVVHTLARTFFALGYAAVRFNYRGVGRSQGFFDNGVGEIDDARAALAHARGKLGQLPLALAGFSFGAYIASRLAREEAHVELVLVGPAVKRLPLEQVEPATIVVHGEQDDVVPLADVLDWARPQHIAIVVFPGSGHFFHGRLLQLQEIVTRLVRRRPHAVPGA